MSNTTNNLTTKRFVIRKSLIGENKVITFTNKKDQTCHVFKSMAHTQTQIQYQNSVEN